MSTHGISPTTASTVLDFGAIAQDTEVTEQELSTKDDSLQVLDDVGLSDDIDQDPYTSGVQDSGPLQNLLSPEQPHDSQDPEDNPPDEGSQQGATDNREVVRVFQQPPRGEASDDSSASLINGLTSGPSLLAIGAIALIVLYLVMR